jgi:putative ABC transport system ATP-binding protein
VSRVVHARGLERSYGAGAARIEALAGLDLDIEEGEMVAIVGPSGSGKTTLLQLLGALDRPTDGTLELAGRDVATLDDDALARLRREEVGFVFQHFNLIPTLDATENVEAAMAPSGLGGAERRRRAEELLEAVGLAARARQLPSRLSGGEQQRVSIARALSNHPRVLLADEPTGNLDSATGESVLQLLRSFAGDDGRTVVLVTHDAGLAATAPRRVALRDGRVVEDTARAERVGGDPAGALAGLADASPRRLTDAERERAREAMLALGERVPAAVREALGDAAELTSREVALVLAALRD